MECSATTTVSELPVTNYGSRPIYQTPEWAFLDGQIRLVDKLKNFTDALRASPSMKVIHNTMEQISIGSVVTLKSGGPQMTVVGYGTKMEFGSILGRNVEDKEKMKCQWFDSTGTLRDDVFPVASLKPA